jgi:hypothetical protein
MTLFEWEAVTPDVDPRTVEFLNYVMRPMFNLLTHFCYLDGDEA